jgi:hypothetical protein
MQVKMKTLRHIIREEFMRGVPEFVIRQAADDCVERVRQHVEKFVQGRAQSQAEARQMMQVANETLVDLEDEIFQTVQDKLWAFVQQV